MGEDHITIPSRNDIFKKMNENVDFDDDKKPSEKKEIINICSESDDSKPWNYKFLIFLRKIGKKTMGYRWMHDQEAQYNEDTNSKYTITEIIILSFIGIISGGELLGLIFNSGLGDNKIALIVLTCVQLVVLFGYSVIKGIRETSEFDKNVFQHNYASSKFGEINLSIQNQLTLNIKDRDTDKDFLKNIIKSFNDLLYIVPKIRKSIKDKYIEGSEDNDMFNPLITDENGNIKIVIHDGTTNLNDSKTKSDDVNTLDSKNKYQIDRWLQHF